MVSSAGNEGEEMPANRPQYYKVPGRYFDSVYVKVPEGWNDDELYNIYVIAVPTPPFGLMKSMVDPSESEHLTWNYQYNVKRMPVGFDSSKLTTPITLVGDEVLEMDKVSTGHGFMYDCFAVETDECIVKNAVCNEDTGNCEAEACNPSDPCGKNVCATERRGTRWIHEGRIRD